MRRGTRVAGRWVVEEELPPVGELRRWRVRDGDATAELVTPAPHVLLRPGARDAFVHASPPEHPAALPTLATDTVDGAPVRVRPPTRGTLAGVRLSAPDAVAVAGWLAPAVVAGAGTGAGELGADDIAVDAAGVPRFAPAGVVRAESVARVPFHKAPEARADAAADLFGLGVTLYRAVTGAEPFPARTAGELRRGPIVPPSASGATTEADALIAGLLAEDPAARLRAVVDLPTAPVTVPESPAASDRAAGLVARVDGGAPARATPAALRTTQPTVPEILPWAVLVPLRGLSPAALRVVAARSAADPAVVQRAAAQGGTWGVDAVATEAEAGRLVRRLEAAGVKAIVAPTTAPRVIQYVLLAGVAFVLAFVSGLPLVFGGLAVVLLYMAAVNLRAMFTVAGNRFAVQERDRAALPDTTPEARLRALRRRVAAAELAESVLADLRDRIARVEERLDAVRGHEAELAASGGGDAELRARQARLADELAQVEAAREAVETDLTRLLTEDLAEDAGAPVARTAVTTAEAATAETDKAGEAEPVGAPALRPRERTPEG